MEKFKKGESIMDSQNSEPEWITVKNGEHVPIKDGQSVANAVEKHFSKMDKKQIVDLPKKEYAELCSAIRTKFANKIPNASNILYKNSYYSYTYSNYKVICTGKMSIVGNEERIRIEERFNNGKTK